MSLITNMKTWIKAARPYSLPVSMSSVFMTVALVSTRQEIKWLPAIICLIFAVLAQITSNFVNDYVDFKKGADDERLGTERMVASGKIKPKSIKTAIIITTILSFLTGLTLLYWGGWVLLPIGIVIIVCAFAYTAGPYPLSYHALGDVAVVLFYGIIPVVMTYYIQTKSIDLNIMFAGIAMGLVVDELLIVNNYRDKEQDEAHNKITTVIVFGRKFMSIIYLLNPIVASVLAFFFLRDVIDFKMRIIIFLPFLTYSIFLWTRLKKLKGSDLNKIMGLSSMCAVIFAITIIIACALHNFVLFN